MLNVGAVIPSPCHESFYGKYRTLLKNARNLPPKGQKRKTVDEHPNNKKPKLQQTVRISDLKVLKGLKGASLTAQMKAWGVPVRRDSVAQQRERLSIVVKDWMQQEKTD